jgi:hypothetical protein
VANTLGYYDQLKYSQQALRVLENTIGMPKACFRGYDLENRSSLGPGSTIRIRRPAAVTEQTLGTGTATALAPEGIEMTLNIAKEANFEVTDLDFAYSGRALMEDHIPRAVYSLVQGMDTRLWDAGYKGTPWANNTTGTTIAVADLAALSRILEVNQVPIADISRMWGAIGPTEREALIQLSAFSQQQGAANLGVNVQTTGQFSEPKYGFNLFSSQNRPTHTPGTMADPVGAITGAHAAGVTSLTIGSVTASSTVKAGDFVTITNVTQRYVITADATASGGGSIVVSISPPLQVALAGAEVATIDVEATKVKNSLFFHSEYMAFAMGPLPEYADVLDKGATIATVSDPRTGLSVRTSYGWNQASKKMLFSVDVLYGIKVLNPNMAVRSRQA